MKHKDLAHPPAEDRVIANPPPGWDRGAARTVQANIERGIAEKLSQIANFGRWLAIGSLFSKRIMRQRRLIAYAANLLEESACCIEVGDVLRPESRFNSGDRGGGQDHG